MADDQMQVDFTQVVNEIANRLRILESKQSLLSEKMLVMNQNMVEEYKKTIKEIKAVDGDLKSFKMDLDNVKNIVRHFSEESSKFAKQSDVKVLEKYIKLWSPMNFVTEKQVQEMIRASLEKQESPVPAIKKVRKENGTDRDTSE